MIKLADHCGRVLAQRMDDAPRVHVLDGDLADSDGAIHVATRHPARFLMAGIAEQNMVSVAAGMAEAGLAPWVFSFAAFLCYRAYDQIRTCVSQAMQPVTLVGSHAGGLAGRNGKTHAAPNDLALMLSLPHMHVWAPGDAADVELAVAALLASPVASYVRCPRTLIPSPGLPGAAAPLRWLLPRQRTVLVSTGLASHWALAAARLLAARGLEVGVLHCARLRPLPALADELHGVRAVFAVDDHVAHGGLGSLLHALGVAARVVGWPADYAGKSGADDDLLEAYGLSPAQLARAVKEA